MRIAIITRSTEIHSTGRLQQAACERGHEAVVVPILHGCVALADDGVAMVAEDVLLDDVDAVIPRIGTYYPQHALSLLRQLELAGCYVLNNARTIEACQDKFRTLAALRHAGIAIPRTVLVKDLDKVSWAIEQVGEPPVILKPVSGSQGRRVVRADSAESARSMLEALLLLDQDVLVQEYIEESAGRDVRILVCGDDVIGAVRREAPPGRFRSNLHQGGRGTALDLADDLCELALRAVRTLGLEVAGIDVLESNRGPLVIEVNASPGLAGFEEATGVDVADRFLQHVEERCRARDRQR